MSISKIAVFCSASDAVEDKYKKLAFNVGASIARLGFDLVTGGGACGLMRKTLEGAHSEGGSVLGVFPENLLIDLREDPDHDCDTLIMTKDLSERKKIIIENAVAFITLPGGWGTMDEFFEVSTLNVVNANFKPNILFNYDNYYIDLIKLIQTFYNNNFTRKIPVEIVEDLITLEGILPKLY